MKLKDIGEIGLIDRISKKIRVGRSVIKGIGDDAAVIKWRPGKYLLFASDMMIEGTHFKLQDGPSRIGRKALAVNISDIAAMGGRPRYAVLSLGVSGRTDVGFIDRLYSGVLGMAKRYGVAIVGGDTDSADKLIIDISIIGEAKKDELALRSGAKEGDIIAVTGRLGGSVKGRHLDFTPRVDEALFLVKNFKIHSMIDISDGLSLDLTRICRASRVGARLYEGLIPVSEDAHSVKDALNSGEDFELLFTTPKKYLKDMLKRFGKRFKTPVTAIGEITKAKAGIKIVDRYGMLSSLRDRGFKHF